MLGKNRYRLKVLKVLLPYSKGAKRFFVLLVAGSIVSLMATILNPYFYRMFIDKVILGRQIYIMPYVAVGYLGLFALQAAIKYLKNYADYSMVNRVLYRVKYRIWCGYYGLPFEEYEKASVGDMKMRLDDDVERIRNFSGIQSVDYVIAVITVIVSLVLILIIDWRLTLFSLLAIPLSFYFAHVISKKEKVLVDDNRENEQRMSSWLYASIQGWREVKALNLSRMQMKRYFSFLHYFALYFAKWINYWTLRVLVIPKLKDEFFMRFGLYFLGGLLVLWGGLRISDLLVFAVYYEMLSGAVQTISNADAELQSNMPFTDRLMEELSKKEFKNAKGIIPDDTNVIEFSGVRFRYENTENDIFSNFHLRIEKGERVAITGRSGSGKTTLLKLITGLVKPTDGVVSFSGIPLGKIDSEEMYRRIGFIMQENILFSASIRENLFYGREDATEAEMRSACERACIQDFIDNLRDGLDTEIGERGIKLSGGQRQRLVLARLFLRDAEVFILDEATSALDQYSENLVYDAIRNIAADKTVIIVSHRESSLSLCDRRVAL